MIQRLFRLLARMLYKLLGPAKSTQLAQSFLGKLFFSAFNPNLNSSVKTYYGIDGIKLKLTQKEAFTMGFFHLGVINPFETQVIKKVLKEGDVFIDVGAYIDGWHSLVASKIVGMDGHVYTFEPLFFKRLEENVKINHLKNITLSNLAVSKSVGTAWFYDEAERSSLLKSHTEKSSQKQKVKTTTLDFFIQKKAIKDIRLIKVDVEGAEMDVINGAKKTLNKNNAPDLLIEVVDKHLRESGSSEKKLLLLLKEFGYNPFAFTTNGLMPYVIDKDKKENNLYFTKNSKKLMSMF